MIDTTDLKAYRTASSLGAEKRGGADACVDGQRAA